MTDLIVLEPHEIAAARRLGHFPHGSTDEYVLRRCSNRFRADVREALELADALRRRESKDSP